MKKLLLIALCLLLACSSVLVSCKKDAPPPVDTSERETETGDEVSYWDQLPENDTGYSELRCIAFTTNCIPQEISVEASAVDQALFKRDAAVMERFNTDIIYTEVTTANAVSQMRISATTEHEHQVFFYQAQQLMQLAAEGLLQELSAVPVLDQSQPWWNQSLNTNMTINGKSFVAAGEWSQWYFGAPIAMAYNKNLANDLGVTEIEDLVDGGDWTYEALYKLACVDNQLNADTDGNSVMNEKDFYAISVYQPGLFGLFVSAGGRFATIGEDDKININISDNASISRLDSIIQAFSSKTTYYSTQITDAENLFMNSQALFFCAPLGFFGDFLDVKFSYGILPCPKWNTEQKDYIACANPQSNFCVSIPRGMTEDELYFVGMFLEGYGCMSHELLKPAKYDEFMALRVASDPASAERMDQMFADLYFDINLVMNFGQTRTLVNNTIYSETTGRYASAVKNSQSLIESDIAKLLAGIAS